MAFRRRGGFGMVPQGGGRVGYQRYVHFNPAAPPPVPMEEEQPGPPDIFVAFTPVDPVVEEERRQQTMSSVFSNHVILEKIIKHSSLKTSRLVCSDWNDIALSLPNRRLTYQYQLECPFVNYKKIFRNLKITFPSYILQTGDELFRNLKEWLVGYGCHVVHVDISNFRYCYKDIILALFQNVNLRSLKISLKLPERERMIADQTGTPIFPPQPMLTSLTITCDTTATTITQGLVQMLITAAPNLTDLTIDGNYYPVLPSGTKLKKLSLTYWAFVGNRPNAGFQAFGGGVKEVSGLRLLPLSDLLHQMATSLVTLSLYEKIHPKPPRGLPEIQAPHSEACKVEFPVFPNVKSLTIISRFHIFRLYENLTPNNFPSVENLCLAEADMNIEQLRIFPRVTCLEVLDIYWPSNLEALLEAFFPSLTKLVLHPRRNGDDDVQQPVISEAFGLLRKLKALKHFVLKIPFSYTFDELVNGLDRIGGEKDLKILEVINYPNNHLHPVFQMDGDFAERDCIIHFITILCTSLQGISHVEFRNFKLHSSAVKRIVAEAPKNVVFTAEEDDSLPLIR